MIIRIPSRTNHQRGKVRHFHVKTVWFYISSWLFTVIAELPRARRDTVNWYWSAAVTYESKKIWLWRSVRTLTVRTPTSCKPIPNFDFKLTSDAKIQPAITVREDSCFWLCSPWSRSKSNFYALIGQNLTGEFMRKIYAASWILFTLFTLTAEADRILSQLVMFLTVFFHWMYKMKYSCYQESLVERCVACQSRKSDFGWHRFRFHLA